MPLARSAISPKADMVGLSLLAPRADAALLSSHHHFTGRGLVIMLRGFQTVHLAARPERRDNHSQHFSRRGLGRRVERCDAFST
jgi:hypothetical protein